MHWTAADVDAASLWQFAAAVDGWNRAHGPEESPEPPSPERFEQMVADHMKRRMH